MKAMFSFSVAIAAAVAVIGLLVGILVLQVERRPPAATYTATRLSDVCYVLTADGGVLYCCAKRCYVVPIDWHPDSVVE